MRRLSLLVVAALVATSCLGSDFADSLEGEWQLTSATVDDEKLALVEANPITILFEGDQAGGTAACNHYGGTFELAGSGISFSDMSITEMACFPPEIMDLELRYMDALSRVRSVILDEGLILRGPGVELTFEAVEPVPDAEMTNVVWVLDGLITGDAVSSVAGERATLEFFTDGSVLGSTGCRHFSGRYEVHGGEVAMTEMASDGQQCEPSLADQDSHVLGVLGDSFRVQIDGGTMTLTALGDSALTYRAEQ